MSYDWDTSKNNGNQFFPGTWYRVDNQNARDKRNWVMVGENTVLPGRPALTPPRPCGRRGIETHGLSPCPTAIWQSRPHRTAAGGTVERY